MPDDPDPRVVCYHCGRLVDGLTGHAGTCPVPELIALALDRELPTATPPAVVLPFRRREED